MVRSMYGTHCLLHLLVLSTGDVVSRQAGTLVYSGTDMRTWTFNVNNQSAQLVLRPRERIVHAAIRLCDGQPSPGYDVSDLDDAASRDNCVLNAVSLVGQILNVPLDRDLLCLGPVLVNTTGAGTLGHFDYTSTGGVSKIHVGIDLPVQIDNCDAKVQHSVLVAPWEDPSTAALLITEMLGLWKASDRNLLHSRVELEQMRKCSPVDPKLQTGRVAAQNHAAFDKGPPVLSFDEFYPRFFKLHWPALIFDWNRVKVSGSFRPAIDGSVCVRIDLNARPATAAEQALLEQQQVTRMRSLPQYQRERMDYTTCFGQENDISISSGEKIDPFMIHSLTAFLKDKDGHELSPLQYPGASAFAEFTFNHKLLPAIQVDLPSAEASSASEAPEAQQDGIDSHFLTLLKHAVSGWIYMDNHTGSHSDSSAASLTPGTYGWMGHTMIGTIRLDALQTMIEYLARQQVAGDLVEAGAWKGGATIFMKGVVRALREDRPYTRHIHTHTRAGVEEAGGGDATVAGEGGPQKRDFLARRVLVADSFRGFAAGQGAEGRDSNGWTKMNFAVDGGADSVRQTFHRYGLLDENVMFVPGFFNDTLPDLARNYSRDAAVAGQRRSIALIRMDSDLYQSTMDVLTNLYPLMAKGGIIVQNNWQYTAARAATVEFRHSRGLDDGSHPMHLIDMGSAYWMV